MKSQKFGQSELPSQTADRIPPLPFQNEDEALIKGQPIAITPSFSDGQQKLWIDDQAISSTSVNSSTGLERHQTPLVDQEESPPSSPTSTSPPISHHDQAKPQSLEEQLAFIAPPEEVTSDGEDCEFHVYDTRYDTRGEKIVLRAGTKTEFKQQKKKSHRACLVLDRKYGHHALRDVVGSYYGQDFGATSATIEEPPRCLFHYRLELQRYAEASQDHQLKAHLTLCLQYMERALHQELKIFETLSANVYSPAGLEHRHLWMVFKPGCLVYSKLKGIEIVTRLRCIDHVQDDEDVFWALTTEGISYVRGEIGLTEHEIFIDQYEGRKPLYDLSASPLQYYPQEPRIRQSLLQRGRRYLSLCGTYHCHYNGPATVCITPFDELGLVEQTVGAYRIMLDAKEYKCRDTNYASYFVPATKTYKSSEKASSELSDELIMTCYPALQGFSLEAKRWGRFLVDHISEVVYNDKAFDALLFPEKKKFLLSSLLKQQTHQQEDNFDDLIRGKGKGLVLLLHGPPGVGKTYTAESLADHTRRPLLKISSAQLMPAFPLLEDRLSKLFELGTRWNAVTLIDEADVFMQERTMDNLQGNQLVSTLLRILEYHEGILFLTTNRPGTIDPAFKSRIHLALAYPPLGPTARHELWRTLIIRANGDRTPNWLTSEFLDQISKSDVNAREIKNIVRLGCSLARSAGRDIEASDLEQGLEALSEFDVDFRKLSKHDKAG